MSILSALTHKLIYKNDAGSTIETVKEYFFNSLGSITRFIHVLNGINSFYYFPQNNIVVTVWLDLGGGAVDNPWDDAQFWTE